LQVRLQRIAAGLLAVAAFMAFVVAAGCGKKNGAEEKMGDPLDPWKEAAARIEERPGVKEAKAFVSGGRHIILLIELDYREITEERIEKLDTGVTRELCAALPSPIEMRVSIPDRGGQEWQGFYVPDGGIFKTFRGSAELEPYFDAETATFFINLPAEG
jgi:hypothetical protein